MIRDAVKEATDSLKAEFDKSVSAMKSELDALKAENLELKSRMTSTERAVEKKEQ